ncbi:MAG TPA: (2Fe-2S)-binding protein [Vulgatibacter sp.]|nr:(2Fe-2S)-binding protein [Vulgatibacter sp.]
MSTDWDDWRDELLEDDWPESLGPAILCRCHGVEEREVEALITAGADLEEIARRTGATTACSGCLRAVQAMLSAAR